MLKFKKIIAALIACAASVSIVATNASAYSLRYAYGAPSNVNILSDSDATTSTGQGYITVNSNQFYTYISGAYVSVNGTSYSTSPLTINGKGTYKLDYSGTTVPKKGVALAVNFSLKDYKDSKGVEASGSISA